MDVEAGLWWKGSTEQGTGSRGKVNRKWNREVTLRGNRRLWCVCVAGGEI